ncbi:putative transporter (transmembrane protein) [Cytobacillus firmus]|uniref:Putative transporter (Transmembrane protein) n=2 Tax=Cytobacillus TaxID=2675230 RepID=A0A366JLV6_CYTFI|nr:MULTISPECIES: mechanosensitive ion channel [Cytobacillus]RBP88022.1 putative transporter (transmembrane protein) [Cytobacillus firmus]TDX37754.1 putative transporter (transmembrane protein) [Cytobacillus oceanisediminis]
MDNNRYWGGFDYLLAKLPDLLLALLVLLVGWIIAKAIEKALLKGLRKTSLDDRVFPDKANRKYSSEKIISKIIYYLLLVFVFILFFNILDLDIIAAPLVGMFSSIMAAVPSILKAALILLFAWLIAIGLSLLIRKSGRTLKVHEKLSKWNLTDNKEQPANVIDNAAKIVFYLTLLVFLPAVLGALNLNGIAGPFTGMLESILAFLPKLLAAALILFVGWFVAKIVRDIVTNFLQAIGSEKLTARLGLNRLFEGTSLASVIGTVVFVLILIPTVIAALERLDIEGISGPAIAMLNDVLTMLPNIAVAIFFVLISVWLGKWVRKFVSSLLERIGLNSYFSGMGLNKSAAAGNGLSFSQLIGYIAEVIIVLLFVVQALNILGLDFLVTLATGVIAYLPHVIAALVILGVGLWLGSLVKKLLSTILQGPHYKFLANVAQAAIIAISIFMALDQLGLAASIVNAAFVLTLGALALAFGLSFGLGGKDFAAKYLQKLDRKIEETTINKDADTKAVMKEAMPEMKPGNAPGSTDKPINPTNSDPSMNPANDPLNPRNNRMDENNGPLK